MSYWGNAVTVRTPHHRLVLKPQGDDAPDDVELYAIDPEATPGEVSFDNIAEAHPTVVERLRQLVP
ncbi:hypothetical protein OT109_05580 [Phycisphaeraceae bacterium D3-23]